MYERKLKLTKGFTKKYNLTYLTYDDETTDVMSAIEREKQIKDWRRSKKIALIESVNPKWKDLAMDWYDQRLSANLSPRTLFFVIPSSAQRREKSEIAIHSPTSDYTLPASLEATIIVSQLESIIKDRSN